MQAGPLPCGSLRDFTKPYFPKHFNNNLRTLDSVQVLFGRLWLGGSVIFFIFDHLFQFLLEHTPLTSQVYPQLWSLVLSPMKSLWWYIFADWAGLRAFETGDPPQALMRDSLEAKKTEKPDAQLQVGDAKDVDFGRVWHLNFDVHAVYQDIYIYMYIYIIIMNIWYVLFKIYVGNLWWTLVCCIVFTDFP